MFELFVSNNLSGVPVKGGGGGGHLIIIGGSLMKNV